MSESRIMSGLEKWLDSVGDTKVLGAMREQRHVVCEVIARAVRRLGGDRGPTRRQTTDVLYAALSPDAYQLLVVERGWTAREWERWTTTLLVDQLADRARR